MWEPRRTYFYWCGKQSVIPELASHTSVNSDRLALDRGSTTSRLARAPVTIRPYPIYRPIISTKGPGYRLALTILVGNISSFPHIDRTQIRIQSWLPHLTDTRTKSNLPQGTVEFAHRVIDAAHEGNAK